MAALTPEAAVDADPVPPSLGERESSQGLRFAAALILQRAPAFLLLPLYARYLSPAEYGQLAILLSISLAGSFLLSFGFETAILRNWIVLAGDPERRQRWITTVATFLLVVPGLIVGAGIGILAATGASPLGLSLTSLTLALLGAAFYTTSTALPFALLRAQNRFREYLVLSAVLGIGGGIATTVAVVAFDGGVDGWLTGRLLGFVATFAAALFLVPWPAPRRSQLARSALASALAFGLPLLPHMASQWIMAASDRLILSGLVPDYDLGQYAVAATLAAGLLLVYGGLSQGSMPAYAHAQDPAGRRLLSRVTSDQFALTALIGFAGAVLLPVFVHEAFPPDFAEAAALCPPLALAYTLAGLYFIPVNTVTVTLGKTQWIWLGSGIAATVNTVLLFALGGSGGVTAAVFAPVAAYGVLLFATTLYARATTGGELGFEWGTMWRASSVVVLAYLAVAIAIPDSGLLGLSLRLIAVALTAAALIVSLPHLKSDVAGLRVRFGARG